MSFQDIGKPWKRDNIQRIYDSYLDLFLVKKTKTKRNPEVLKKIL